MSETRYPKTFAILHAMDHATLARYALDLLQTVVEEVGPHNATDDDMLAYMPKFEAYQKLIDEGAKAERSENA